MNGCIRLDATTRKLQAYLAGAAATTNPTVTVGFYDNTRIAKADFSEYVGTMQYTVLAGATETDVCDAPAAGTTRNIDYICVYNTDTASVDVFIVVDDAGTNRIQAKITLATTESAIWTPQSSWKIVT